MKTTTDMQLVSIDRLVPYANNARTHSPEQLTKLRSSLREFGFINPVIIDRDFNVIAGHGRIAAAKEEGITEVPCVFVDYLTEAQKKAYILADNRMALDAGWDEELLRIEIKSLQGADFDVSLTGFGEDEIADLFAGDREKDVKDDDFDLSAALEKGGAAYVFHADTEGLNFRKAFVDAGFHLAGVCIWVKNSLVLGRSDYQWQHEPVLYGFLKNGKHPWYSDRKQTTIWNYDKPKRNKNHPTSKPLDLLGYPICNSSQENAIVLDTFGGSGSTMMACEQTNRICHMMELDEKYASVILRRYVEDTGDSENVYVVRGGEKIPYSALVKEVEME